MYEDDRIRYRFMPEGANFVIKIFNCRQNNWKGEIRWLNGRDHIYFRSLLEMVMLLQEALEQQGLHDQADSFRSWIGEGQIGEK